MFTFASLLTTLLLALSIAASPVEVRNSPITLPIARNLNLEGGTINLLQHDQARAAALKSKSGSTSITNSAVTYTAKVGVGSPATTYTLIVDTGSSNTWVGANKTYVKTSTSHSTGQPVSVGYGSGFFSGTEYTDTVSLGSGLTITKQSIGVASLSSGFHNVDGILGLGPLDLTAGTLKNKPSATIPTVTQNLYRQGTIPEMIVSVSFEPDTSGKVTSGELTFGGVDSTKYTGSIAYTPVTTTSPSSQYWGIDEEITYGSTTILSKTAGIVDHGTTLILLATDAFKKYQSATGSTMDQATGLLTITKSKYDAMQNLNFKIGSNTYTLTPNGQIWPRSLNTYIGGSSGHIYLVVNDIFTPSTGNFDFINGYSFLERFYSVLDTTESRVGFATTSYTDATTN